MPSSSGSGRRRGRIIPKAHDLDRLGIGHAAKAGVSRTPPPASSPATRSQSRNIVTALNPYIGYRNATEVALEAHRTGQGVVEIVLQRGLMSREHLEAVLRPETLTRPNEILNPAEAR